MNKPGINISIPGFGDLRLRHIVSDYTGTLSCGGRLVSGIVERLRALDKLVDVHVVSADSFGTAPGQLAQIPLTPVILTGDNHDRQKEEYPGKERIDYREVIALGNGNNDRLLLKKVKSASGLDIAVDNGEGCAWDAIQNAHLFVAGAVNALDLLLEPTRCKATLRS